MTQAIWNKTVALMVLFNYLYMYKKTFSKLYLSSGIIETQGIGFQKQSGVEILLTE